MQTFIQFLKAKLSSSHCIFCQKQAPIHLSLCEHCIDLLPENTLACSSCAIPLQSTNKQLCGQCQQEAYQFDRSISPYLYQQKMQPLIHQLKYHQQLFLARTLAQLFLKNFNEQKLPEVLVPVPLHKNKYHQRGYNQSLELAYFIGKALAIPVNNKYIIRVKDTQSQQSLNAQQRKQNIKGAFALAEYKTMPYHHIALIDDVMTTGNTLNEIAKLLKKSGVKQVDTWTIARA